MGNTSFFASTRTRPRSRDRVLCRRPPPSRSEWRGISYVAVFRARHGEDHSCRSIVSELLKVLICILPGTIYSQDGHISPARSRHMLNDRCSAISPGKALISCPRSAPQATYASYLRSISRGTFSTLHDAGSRAGSPSEICKLWRYVLSSPGQWECNIKV